MGDVSIFFRNIRQKYSINSYMEATGQMLMRLMALGFWLLGLILLILVLAPVVINLTLAFAPIISPILLAAALFLWSKSGDKYR